MISVRDLVLTSLTYNILFRARHVPGVHITGVDGISRFQVKQFKRISPQGGQIANASSHPPSARELVPTLKGLINSALSSGTLKVLTLSASLGYF